MKKISDFKKILIQNLKTVVSIGNFDGLHLGHKKVLAVARQTALEKKAEFVVCTFFPHPAEFINSSTKMRLITPCDKEKMFAKAGVDVLLEQSFNDELASMSPEAFVVEILAGALRACVVVVGEGFRFGNKRKGDVFLLKEMGKQLGFEVIAVKSKCQEGQVVSSSRIRDLIIEGRVDMVSRLLGRNYELKGKVIKGMGKASKMGFPTANIEGIMTLIPKDGIYATKCTVEEKGIFPAAVYIGNRSTLGYGKAVEAHLMGFSDNLYGANVTVSFDSRVRNDQKFSDVESLVEQIKIDILTIEKRLEVGIV